MSVPGKKNIQTCAQRMGRGGQGTRGRVYKEESVRCCEDGDHETESDCWRICVQLNPERKGDQFDSFFFFPSVRPQQHLLCPLPTPLALSLTPQSCSLVLVVKGWVSGGWGVGTDTPGRRSAVARWACTLCLSAIWRAHASKHADLTLVLPPREFTPKQRARDG